MNNQVGRIFLLAGLAVFIAVFGIEMVTAPPSVTEHSKEDSTASVQTSPTIVPQQPEMTASPSPPSFENGGSPVAREDIVHPSEFSLNTPQGRDMAIKAWYQGKLVLDCMKPCLPAFAEAEKRGEFQKMISKKQWRKLAMKVIEIRYNVDVAYLYLGMAAENTNASVAALTNYSMAETLAKGDIKKRLSTESAKEFLAKADIKEFQCKTFNLCNNLDVAKIAGERQRKLTKKIMANFEEEKNKLDNPLPEFDGR